jgi:hypothetical protein
MREQLQSKVEELKKEFSVGQVRLADLQNQEASLNQQLLRISGAILVLQELIGQNSPDGQG